jgi:hypothetical protein
MVCREKEGLFVSVPMDYLNRLLVSGLLCELYQLFRHSAKQSDYLLQWTLREKKLTAVDTKISEYFYMISLIPIRLIFRITSF